MQMKLDEAYRTSDLYVAAWLLTKGFQLQDIDHSNNRRCDFVFADRQDRPQLVCEFLRGRAVGNLADFIFHLRRAKRALYLTHV
jgi:hypothetical protein